jgi:hypothetical protein
VRIFLAIIGLLLLLAGGACTLSGVATLRALDGDGYINGNGRISTTTAALVIDTSNFRDLARCDAAHRITVDPACGESTAAEKAKAARIKISARRTDKREVFVAIAPAEQVESFVSNGSSEVVSELKFDPLRYDRATRNGTAELPAAESANFVASAVGRGVQEAEAEVREGAWEGLVMNADGAPNVEVQLTVGVKYPHVRAFAVVAVVLGGTALGVGLLLLFFQLRRRKPAAVTSAPSEELVEQT